MLLEAFLTSYDPSDLPGSSVDPLGFERGYLALADLILPGLTNVASYPRYFGLLCAGLSLAGEAADRTLRDLLRHRKEILLRTERFWALANVMAKGEADSGGVRGVRYAQARMLALQRRGRCEVGCDFKLLLRQEQYGVLGMYGAVADGLRLLNRDCLSPTPDLGEVMAEAFISETELPRSLRRAIVEDGEVSESVLRAWGTRAHLRGPVGPREADCLRRAAHFEPRRSRMLRLLLQHPPRENVDEQSRIRSIASTLSRTGGDTDLRGALVCIVAYEECFQLVQLGFERLLWLCRRSAKAMLDPPVFAADSVLELVRAQLPQATVRLERRFCELDAITASTVVQRIADARQFLSAAANASSDPQRLVSALLERHGEVQRGKFERGRRKMPWLERRDDAIALSTTRTGGLAFEATKPSEIAPHPYRLFAADALNEASLRK